MEKGRSTRVLAIVAICIAIVGLTIGYAALSTTLTVNTKTTVKGSTWSVKFANLSQPALTGSATVENAATLDSTLVTVDVAVKKPGDSVVYTFDVTNDGTLDAQLSSLPTFTGVTEAAEKYVNYTLTYADGSTISANDTLAAGATRNLKLTVTFDANATTVAADDQVLNISAVLLYEQK